MWGVWILCRLNSREEVRADGSGGDFSGRHCSPCLVRTQMLGPRNELVGITAPGDCSSVGLPLGPHGLLGGIIWPLAARTHKGLASSHGSGVTRLPLHCTYCSQGSSSDSQASLLLPHTPKNVLTLPLYIYEHTCLYCDRTHHSHSFVQRKNTG